MTQTLFPQVAARMLDAGHDPKDVAAGLDLARELGAQDNDEALSIAVAFVHHGADDVREGIRFPVEPGSVGWAV